MPIPDSLRVVNHLVTDGSTKTAAAPAALHPLLPEVQKRTQQPGGVFYDCVDTCNGTGYDHRCHEIQMWHIGLMFAEYIAGLVADKAKTGHCHAKGKVNPYCSQGRKLHLDMLARFKQDLSKLIEDIEDIEKDATNWPKAEVHPPQKPGQ